MTTNTSWRHCGRALAALLLVLAAARSARAGDLFYQEAAKDGRIYVFAIGKEYAAWSKSGEIGKAITRVGYGPNGETVVFDSEEAVNLYNFKHDKPGEVWPKAAAADEPAALRLKGITFTPTGFAAAETVYRNKALSADVNTPFNSAPYDGASNSKISEFNASGRQSRIGALAQGELSRVTIGSYYEGDFLGAGSASNNNQSNSYVFRQRQFWAQAAFKSGATITGGQMWSLVTETTKGLDPRSEALPQVIDAQYVLGFSWARQYGLRFTKAFDKKFFFGLSIEGSETTFTVHGNPTSTVTSGATTVLVPCTGTAVPPCTASVGGTSTTFTNFLLGAAGASGGLLDPLANYSYNKTPDGVAKFAIESGHGHYEVFGIVGTFRDRIFPCQVGVSTTSPCSVDGSTKPSAVGAFNDSKTGGGFGANLRWSGIFDKHLDFGLHYMYGKGTGRYGSGGLPDATIDPQGHISLLKNQQALATLQIHPDPKLDINIYVGGEWSDKGAFVLNGKGEGYGSPLFVNTGCSTETGPITTTPVGTTAGQGYVPGPLSNCTGDTHKLIEGSIMAWYRFYKGSKGTVQFGVQYSGYKREAWTGVGGAPDSTVQMFFTSLRYYMP